MNSSETIASVKKQRLCQQWISICRDIICRMELRVLPILFNIQQLANLDPVLILTSIRMYRFIRTHILTVLNNFQQ